MVDAEGAGEAEDDEVEGRAEPVWNGRWHEKDRVCKVLDLGTGAGSEF